MALARQRQFFVGLDDEYIGGGHVAVRQAQVGQELQSAAHLVADRRRTRRQKPRLGTLDARLSSTEEKEMHLVNDDTRNRAELQDRNVGQNRKKYRINSHLINRCPKSKRVSKVSE